MLRTSSDGRAIIEQFEGCEKAVKNRPGFFTTYRDEVGVLTVCYGCTNLSGTHAPVVEGAVYSKADCDQLLSSDLAGFEQRVVKILAGVALKQCEFDALVSFDFNTGGLDRSSIPAKIRSGRAAEVPDTLSRWNKAGGRVYAGLTRRRTAEGQEFVGNLPGALATAGVHRGSGDGMPQKVDRPSVPAGNVVAATKKERRAAAGGAATAGGGTVAQGTQQPSDAPALGAAGWVAIAAGLAIVLVAAVLIVRRWRLLNRDWA
jgi:lysozyme